LQLLSFWFVFSFDIPQSRWKVGALGLQGAQAFVYPSPL